MFKRNLKTYILSLVCALTLALPQVLKAQGLNQSVVARGPFATTYYFTNTDFDLSPIIYASSGLPVIYSSDNPAVATIVGNKIHPVGIGSFVLTLSQPGDATYNAAPDMVVTITLVRGYQNIIFPEIPSKASSAPDFDPGATTDSGLPVTYTSSNTAVATIVGGNIHIVGIGTTNITASQAGDANFRPATSVIRTFSVSPNTQTVTINPINKAYLDPNFTPAASTSSGLPISYYTSSNPAVATIIGSSTIRIMGVGTSTITAYQTGTTTYQAASASTTLTVSKASQNIFFTSSATKSFDTPDYDPLAVASSNLPVTYSSSNTAVATIVANKIHITGAGTTVITASQTGDALYLAAPDVTQNLTITKANPVITFPDIASRPLSTPDFDPGATSSSGLPVIYTSSNPAVATIAGNLVHIVGLGTTDITASHPGDANNNAAVSVTKTLTISSSAQTINFPAITPKVLGTADFDPGASASSGLPVTYTSSDPAVATIVANRVHLTGAGTTTITASQLGNGTYTGATASVVLTVNKKDQTITFNPIPVKLRSDADFTPEASSSSGLTITYTSSNPAVAMIVDNQIRLVGAGTANITAHQAGDATYNAAADETQALTVNKGNQEIIFPIIPPKTMLDVDFDPGSTANSGLQTIYTSSNPAVATIVGRLVHIVGIGSTEITASQPGDANYNPASVKRLMTVSAIQQVINFPAIPNAAMGDADFDPGATVNSPLAITYTSSNPAVATIVAGKIHIVGAGTTTITASQPGDGVYAAADSRVRQLTVTKRLQTITFPVIPVKTLGDADFPTGATINSPLTINYTSSNPAVATVSGGVIHIVAAGTTTITASQLGDSNYEAATSVSRTLTVNGNGVQTITFNPIPDKPFSTLDFNPGAVSNSGLPVVYTSSDPAVATIVNNNVHMVSVGTTTITATQPGNINYAATSASTTLNIIKGTATITFPAIPQKVVNNVDFDLFATNIASLPITYSSDNPAVATIVANKVHLVGAGTAVITASHAGNANYNPATADQPLVVNKGFQIITFPVIPPTLPSAADFDPGATVNSGLPITYTSDNPAVATIVAGKIHIIGLGTATITASQPGDANYTAAVNVTRTLTVGKGTQSISFPTITAKLLTTPDFDPGATASSGLGVTYTSSNPAVATIVAGKIHIVGLGSTNITASQTGNADYQPAPDVTRLLHVSANAQYITFDATLTRQYGSPDFTPAATASSGLAIAFTSSNPAVATVIENRLHITGVGSTVITAIQVGNELYAGATAVSTLTVTKADQVINFPALPVKQRNDPDFPIGATSSSGLTVFYISSNPSVALVVGNRIQITGVGTAVISAYQPGDNNYNVASVVNQSFTVLKPAQTITFPDLPIKSLTDADFEPGATASSGLTVTYTSSNPAVATIVDGKIHITGIGNSTITASQTGDANYSAALNVSKVFTVRGMSQTITFNALPNKKVGDADFDAGATVSTGLPLTYSSSDPAVATIVGGKIHIVGAGTTTITVNQAGDATYAPASASVTLTVELNAQTITFPSISTKELNTPDFDPGATASSGLAVTYTSSDASVATIVAGKVHIVGAGATTITASQAGNATYAAATPVAVTFLVNKGNQSISFPAIPVKLHTDADFDLNATASSGLAVTYTSSNPAVATISGNKVHIVASGSTVITASQAGNSNYNAAASVTQDLTVSYVLPANNYRVRATDVTCKGSNNGAISITATQNLNYTATITGNNKTTPYPFNTTLTVNDLPAGSYTITISIAGQTGYSSQPFNVVIKEPKDLAVYATMKPDGNTVLLKLEGGDVYHINLNGKMITTSDNEIVLPLVQGNNVVKISSDKTCQGVIEKTFLTSTNVSLYPNPVKDILTINTGSLDNQQIKVEINALDGRRVHSSQQVAQYGRISVDLSKLNRGLYVLTLTIGNHKTVHKVIKD